jgi:hypothetical protein
MSSDDSIADRISSFISGHRRGIVIGAAAAAVAVGGVAYYVASSRAGVLAGDEESVREGKKKDRRKRKHKKSTKDKDGPILEETKPKATEESEDGCVANSPPWHFAPSLTFGHARPTLDRGADPGARYRGKHMRVALGSGGAHPKDRSARLWRAR